MVTLLRWGYHVFVVQVAQTTSMSALKTACLRARSMRLYLEEADLTGPRLNERVKQLGQQGGRYLTVFDADGGILARSYSEDIAPEDLITAAVRLNEGHILQIGVPRAEVRSKVTQLIHGAIMVGVLVAGLAVLVAYLVNRVIAGPIMDLLVVVRRPKHREPAAGCWCAVTMKLGSSAELQRSV